MKKLKGIDGKLDTAWSKLVKLKAGNRCEIEICNKKEHLNSHHIFTRQNKSVRWATINGVCLCPSHHTLNSKFSAHGTPILFTDWLRKKRGNDNVDLLTFKAHQISKLHPFEKKLLLDELNNEIKNIEK